MVSALESASSAVGSLCCDSSPVVFIQCAVGREVKAQSWEAMGDGRVEEKTSSLAFFSLLRLALPPRDLSHAVFSLTMPIYWKIDDPLVTPS